MLLSMPQKTTSNGITKKRSSSRLPLSSLERAAPKPVLVQRCLFVGAAAAKQVEALHYSAASSLSPVYLSSSSRCHQSPFPSPAAIQLEVAAVYSPPPTFFDNPPDVAPVRATYQCMRSCYTSPHTQPCLTGVFRISISRTSLARSASSCFRTTAFL